MKNCDKILLVLLIIVANSFSQTNPGSRQVALAHSDISISKDVFSLFNNPAGLSKISNREIGLYYSPAPFGIKELSNGFGAYVEPTSFGSFSGGFMIYGFDLYKETRFALGYSTSFEKNFNVGLTTIYKNISIPSYGSKGYLYFNIGSIVQISELISFGFTIENITNTKVADEENQIPVVFWSGIGLKLIKELNTFLAVKKEINYNLSVRFGVEYFITEFLKLWFGTASEPSFYSGGFGFAYQFFQVEYAVTSHPDLGLTHQFGLIIQLKTE